MKIVHVIRSIDPAAGGPPLVVVRLAAAQAALGHQVHIVTYDYSAGRERVEQQLARVPHLNQVRIHTTPDPSLAERLLARRAREALSGLLSGADWVHLHGIWESSLRAAARMAWRAGVPYCFRPAGMLDPWSLAQKRWKKRLALALGLRRILDRAAFIHALNDDEARLIEPLGLRTPSVVIPNGVFLEEIEPLPPPGTFLAAHQRLRGRLFILFLSRLHYKKGLDYLADAFAAVARELSDVDLVVAGPDDGARDDFVARVRRAGVEDRTHLVGGLYGQDKFAALVDCACFCLPSRQEGFSVAVTEALACGVPVVISDACHFPEVAEAGAGRVVPLDPARIADALLAVLRDPEARRRMGQAGRAMVTSRFTWPAIAQRTIDAYQRFTSNRPSAASATPGSS